MKNKIQQILCLTLYFFFFFSRVIRLKVRHSRRRTQRLHLQHWQSHAFKQRFARIAFLDRLRQFRSRELLTKVKRLHRAQNVLAQIGFTDADELLVFGISSFFVLFFAFSYRTHSPSKPLFATAKTCACSAYSALSQPCPPRLSCLTSGTACCRCACAKSAA